MISDLQAKASGEKSQSKWEPLYHVCKISRDVKCQLLQKFHSGKSTSDLSSQVEGKNSVGFPKNSPVPKASRVMLQL